MTVKKVTKTIHISAVNTYRDNVVEAYNSIIVDGKLNLDGYRSAAKILAKELNKDKSFGIVTYRTEDIKDIISMVNLNNAVTVVADVYVGGLVKSVKFIFS